MLGNLRISSKLQMMVALSVLGIAAVAGVGLSALWSNLLEDRKAKLQDVALLARQAIEQNYQTSQKAGLSQAETLERSKGLLRSLRYGKDDYLYAFNAQGILQVNPNPKVEGTNSYDTADSDGVYFIRDQIALAANGGGITRYRYPGPVAPIRFRRCPTSPSSSLTAGSSAPGSTLTTSIRSFGPRRFR